MHREIQAIWQWLTSSARLHGRTLSGAVCAVLAILAAPLAAAPALAPAATPGPPAAARPPAPPPHPAGPLGPNADINETTVGIVTGGLSGTYIQFASDLSNVLDSPGKLRILAVLGKGSLQNVEDILKVRGIDVGIVQSDVLTYIKKRGLFPGVENRLQYVTKLYNEEFHLLTRNDIGKLDDLRDQKVNFGLKGSGIAITASIVFDLLKIKVEPTYEDPPIALEKLKRGEIAAVTGVYGKPAKIYEGLKAEDNLKFLAVPPDLELSKVYFPSTLTDKEYPGLIGPGETVDTIAVGAVMVVFGWEPSSWRYNKVARFVNMFFANLEQLQKPPRHQKWQEVNLVAQVPGWVRFPAADAWLKQASAAAAATAGKSPVATELTAFKRFMSENYPAEKDNFADEDARRKLFQAFDRWRKDQTAQ